MCWMRAWHLQKDFATEARCGVAEIMTSAVGQTYGNLAWAPASCVTLGKLHKLSLCFLTCETRTWFCSHKFFVGMSKIMA